MSTLKMGYLGRKNIFRESEFFAANRETGSTGVKIPGRNSDNIPVFREEFYLHMVFAQTVFIRAVTFPSTFQGSEDRRSLQYSVILDNVIIGMFCWIKAAR